MAGPDCCAAMAIAGVCGFLKNLHVSHTGLGLAPAGNQSQSTLFPAEIGTHVGRTEDPWVLRAAHVGGCCMESDELEYAS